MKQFSFLWISVVFLVPSVAESAGGDGAVTTRSGHAPAVIALTFSPDGRELLVGSQKGIEVLSWPEMENPRALETSLSHVHKLSFSPDGKWLAAVGGIPAEEGTVEVRRWPGGEIEYEKSPHYDLIYDIAWTPDSKGFSCASYDRSVGIYEAATGKQLHTIKGHSRPVLALSFVDEGKSLVTAGVDRSLRVWEYGSLKKQRVLQNHTDTVYDLAERPGQDPDNLPMLASVSEDGTLRLWQPTIGRLVRFVRLPSVPLSVEWSGDGRYLIVPCKDGNLRIVDADTIEIVRNLPGVRGWAYSVAVPPGGNDVAVAVGGEHGQVVRCVLSKEKGKP